MQKINPEKLLKIIVAVGAQFAKFNCICLSFDLWMTEMTEKKLPSNPMECVHGNMSMFALELHIQKL